MTSLRKGFFWPPCKTVCARVYVCVFVCMCVCVCVNQLSACICCEQLFSPAMTLGFKFDTHTCIRTNQYIHIHAHARTLTHAQTTLVGQSAEHIEGAQTHMCGRCVSQWAVPGTGEHMVTTEARGSGADGACQAPWMCKGNKQAEPTSGVSRRRGPCSGTSTLGHVCAQSRARTASRAAML